MKNTIFLWKAYRKKHIWKWVRFEVLLHRCYYFLCIVNFIFKKCAKRCTVKSRTWKHIGRKHMDEIAECSIKRNLATNCNLCEKNYGWLVMVMDLSSRFGDWCKRCSCRKYRWKDNWKAEKFDVVNLIATAVTKYLEAETTWKSI